MIVIGLTGGPGTGKTLASGFLKEKGAIILSGDDAGRKAVEKNPKILKRLIRVFSMTILTPNSHLNRRKLGTLVFSNVEARQKLNEIVHPELLKLLKADLLKYKKNKRIQLIVIDAALIFEWGIADWCDYIVVVTAKRDVRIKRMMLNGLSRADAINRIASQIPQKEKEALADYVIVNNGTKAELKRKISKFLIELKKAKNR